MYEVDFNRPFLVLMDVLYLWYLLLKITSVLVILRLSTLSVVLFFMFVEGIYVRVDCLFRMIVLWLGGFCIYVERVCRLCLRILFRDFCLLGVVAILSVGMFLFFVLCWFLLYHYLFCMCWVVGWTFIVLNIGLEMGT